MNPILYPEACRKYAELSPDLYCKAHLDNWLDEQGRSLKSWGDWLLFRLATDRLPLVDTDFPYDDSIFDNLDTLG